MSKRPWPEMRVRCDCCDRLATGALTTGDRTDRRFSCDDHRERARSLEAAAGTRFPELDFDRQLMPAIREQYPEAVRDRLVPGAPAEWVHNVRRVPRYDAVTVVSATTKTVTVRLPSGETKRVPLVKLRGIGLAAGTMA